MPFFDPFFRPLFDPQKRPFFDRHFHDVVWARVLCYHSSHHFQSFFKLITVIRVMKTCSFFFLPPLVDSPNSSLQAELELRGASLRYFQTLYRSIHKMNLHLPINFYWRAYKLNIVYKSKPDSTHLNRQSDLISTNDQS